MSSKETNFKELLMQAWKEVFNVEEVDDDADFFEAGGDSIMAVQLSAWLIQKGIKLELVDVFMTPKLSELAEKLVETEPVYVPEALLTKSIAAKEMGFASVEEAMAAEKAGMMPPIAGGNNTVNDQQVCTPNDQQVCTPNDQQVCTPNDQQVCTPNDQQVCMPANGQQVCMPTYGQQVCMPNSQQVCMPAYGQQVCMPAYGQQVCMPNSQQVCMPTYGQQVCMPTYGQQVCMPAYGQQVCMPNNQQVCSNGPMNMAGGLPPQLQKYLSHPMSQAAENPNVIKIEKATIAEKKGTAEEALMVVMTSIIPNFDKNADFFEQGLTSFDTVKMVTRCAENGYKIDMKDIYMHPNFNELVECME